VAATRTIVSEDRKGAGTRFLTSMLTGFAVFAALLASLGIYGVTTYTVQQREREIAIRVAVGASRGSIIRLFLKEGVRVLGIGLGCGLIGAIGATRILQNQVYGVQPFDAATLLSVLVLMSFVGLLSIWRPAKRGAMRDPMTVLKEG